MMIQPAVSADIRDLGHLAEAADLPPMSMSSEMTRPALAGGEDAWLVADGTDRAVGYAFALPEKMSGRVRNLRAARMHSDVRGQSLGRTVLKTVRTRLGQACMKNIETTRLPQLDAATALYAKVICRQATCIPGFYTDCEDKIIFRKHLGGAA